MQLSRYVVVVFMLFAVGGGLGLACAQEGAASEDDKTLYALGIALSQNLRVMEFTEDELAAIQRGLVDGSLGRTPEVELDQYLPKLQEFMQGRAQRIAVAQRARAAEFVEKAAGEAGAQRSDSGLVYNELVAGTGANPTASDTVTVHYHGTLIDGTVFDSSRERGDSVTFPLSGVIPCWTEGVQKMKVGGKSKLVCPPDIAYGDRGAPPSIPPGAALVFEVELLGIEQPAPADGE